MLAFGRRRVDADPAPKLISILFPDWMQTTGPWSTLKINGCRVTPHNPVGYGGKSGGCFFQAIHWVPMFLFQDQIQ
ncbi:MAG: hypothetical protein ACI9HY_002008 [Planctomycetaceae bacterium]|jgi:hypothetical protein